MKVPSDLYKGLHATSKGHIPFLIPVAAMGKRKQAMNFKTTIMHGHPVINNSESELVQLAI